MKKFNFILWCLPLCFFIFLATFIFVKFIFIYFFNAAFEPGFIFDLTPYYLLSGVSSLHLILLSLIVVGFNAYLHFKISKKNLILSFIPTGILLAGLGFKVILQEMEISNVLHYLIFGFLLIIALVDHRHILIFPEIAISTEKEKTVKSKPIISKIKYQNAFKPQHVKVQEIEKTSDYISAKEILELHKETLSDLRSILKDDLRRAKDLLEELEHRTSKFAILEKGILNKKNSIIPQEIGFICPYRSISNLDESNFGLEKEKQIQKDNFDINKYLECAAIIKRGVLKEVNSSFAELLGFEKEFLLKKSLFNFVAPEGLFNIEEYYLNRLKGSEKISCKTILLKNDKGKIQVEIIIKPINYYGEIAEIAIFKELK